MRIFWEERRIDRLEKKVDRLETRIDRLETKMDAGFATIRSEARADFRTLPGVLLAMFMAMILGFAGILLQHL
jgi:tetrahydromethanopterin S-methyltransferase subunit B